MTGLLKDAFEEWERQKPHLLRGPYEHIDHSQLEEPAPIVEREVPEIREAHWARHGLLLADSGAGKSNVLKWRMSQLFPRIAEGKHTLIFTDPFEKGVITEQLLWLPEVYEMRERVLLIRPFDPNVAINLFHLHEDSPQAIAEAMGRIENTFGTVAMALSPTQIIPFQFALRALFALPPPHTMQKFQRILEKGIDGLDLNPAKLSDGTRNFFQGYQKTNRAEETINKLRSFLANPCFEMLFDTDRTTINLDAACQAGKLIILDCSDAPRLYGRFWLDEIAATIRPRLHRVRKGERVTPTTLIVDEFQEYASEHFCRILDKAREAKLAGFVACHHFDQKGIDEAVRQSLLTNTKVKLVARTSSELPSLTRAMGMTQIDMLRTLDDYEFAYHTPGMHEAEVVKFPEVDFTKMPRISEEQHEELLECARPRANPPTPPAPIEVLREVVEEELESDFDYGPAEPATFE